MVMAHMPVEDSRTTIELKRGVEQELLSGCSHKGEFCTVAFCAGRKRLALYTSDLITTFGASINSRCFNNFTGFICHDITSRF